MVSITVLSKRALPCVAAFAFSACTIVPYEQANKGGYNGASTQTPAQQPTAVETQLPQEALIVPQQPQASAQHTETAKSLPAAERIRQLATAEGDKGEYKRAIALLERALRISPRDPETYYELARNHLLMDNPSQAMQLAQRGLSNKPNADQRSRLERLIEDCKAKLTA